MMGHFTNRKLSAAKLLLFASLSACAWTGDQALTQVGDFTITRAMAEYREKVARVYYPNEPARVGLDQLIRAYILAEILRRQGRPVTESALAQEEKRIDASTRDPVTLSRIKAIFGSDQVAYRKIFILPVYVERIFYYEFFLNSQEVQAPLRKKAEEFLLQVRKNPKNFLEFAKARKLTTNEVFLIPSQGLEWKPIQKIRRSGKSGDEAAGSQTIDQIKKSDARLKLEQRMSDEANFQRKEQARLWLDEVVGRTKPGAVFESLVDLQESWAVLKYLGGHRFYAVTLPKVDFGSWLENEKKRISVRSFQKY